MRRRTLCLAVLLALTATWVIGLGCWPFVTWSRLNCSCEDIDINSGRIRYRRYLLGLHVHTSIAETSLSRQVSADAGVDDPNWRCVNTFSPLVHHSPQYRYHGAISDVRLLESFWRTGRFTSSAQRQMARDILLLWQGNEGTSRTIHYLNEVDSMFSGRDEKVIDIGDLPTIHATCAQRP